jgi:segregation and condensation protein A
MPMTQASDDYRVQLDAYSGPLDLLLHLVKRHEIDLNDIPIAQLTDQYLRHLQLLQLIDVDQAGEFLVMAATLLEIKSQLLMPRPQEAQDACDDPASSAATDPRYELVQQLLAYKRYKDAAIALEDRYDSWSSRFPVYPVARLKPDGADPDAAEPVELDLEDVHILDLCEAFANILDSIGQKREHEVTYDDTPISLHAEDIFDRLKRDGSMSLQAIFQGRPGRSEMIGLFLAMLELVRQRRVRATQDKIAGEICLEIHPDADKADASAAAEPVADWRDPETGEIEYDWPDEQARRRAERRAKIRASRAARGEFGRVDDEELDDEDLADDVDAGSGDAAEDLSDDLLIDEDDSAAGDADTDEPADH